MARFCLIDFETASSCDLKKSGAWRYGEDITTEILCLGWTCGAGNVVLWGNALFYRDDQTANLEALVNDPECIFVAHNCAFEKAIWRNLMMPVYGWPDIPNERWHDTQAVCAMKGLPLKLERAAKVLGLEFQKDMAGSRATVALSKPNRKGYFDRSDDALRRVYDYNGSDLSAELQLHRRIRGLGAAERAVWLLDQKINERGVRLDLAFIESSQKIVDQATGPLAKEFEILTGLRHTQTEAFKAWLIKEGCPFPRDADGNPDTSLAKDAIAKLLGTPDEEDDSLADDDDYTSPADPQIRLPFQFERALSIRQILGSASIKKLAAMRACVCSDGRARGLVQYHGAGPGRWAGRLLQPQNFPRPNLKVDGEAPNQDELIAAILSGDAEWVRCLYGEPINVIASGLRHALIADNDDTFAVGDFAKIECVIVLALAGHADVAADVLAKGSAVYTDAATQIFGFPVKKTDLKEYTIGKNSILGCGFQMGWRKFKGRYWNDATDEEAQDVVTWYREEFAPAVPKLWRALEEASVNTAWSGSAHMAYGVTYALEDGWMTARLPSGRKLWYRDPKPVRKVMPWDHSDVRPGWEYSAWKMGQWKRVSAYGGLLTENVVQALARDLLVNAMFACEANEFPLVLTVHDEVVAEVDKRIADAKALEHLMTDRPDWARSLQIPVGAECWIGDRYRK